MNNQYRRYHRPFNERENRRRFYEDHSRECIQELSEDTQHNRENTYNAMRDDSEEDHKRYDRNRDHHRDSNRRDDYRRRDDRRRNDNRRREDRSAYSRDDRSNERRNDRRRDNERRDDDPNRLRRNNPKPHVSSRVWKKIEYHHFSKDSNFYDIEEWVICLENFKHDEPISLVKG